MKVLLCSICIVINGINFETHLLNFYKERREEHSE